MSKGLFDRGLRRRWRQTPRIRETYILEILLPVSGRVLRQNFGSDWTKLCTAYNEWISPRDRTTAPPILWVDIIKHR